MLWQIIFLKEDDNMSLNVIKGLRSYFSEDDIMLAKIIFGVAAISAVGVLTFLV